MDFAIIIILPPIFIATPVVILYFVIKLVIKNTLKELKAGNTIYKNYLLGDMKYNKEWIFARANGKKSIPYFYRKGQIDLRLSNREVMPR